MEPVALNRVDAARVSSDALRPVARASSHLTPLEALQCALRRAGTAFMFAVFGIGAVVTACIAIPILARRQPGVARDLVAQRLIHRCFRAFERLGVVLRLFEVRGEHVERLRDRPALVVANHPTILDVVFLVARMPQADCIVKLGAWHNPFLRRIVSIAGYVANAEGPAVIDACVERLRAGRSVIVFPEGTRSPVGGLRPFKRGAARVALESRVPITPVAIRCEPPALNKERPWWAMPPQRLMYTLEVDRPWHAVDRIGSEGESSTPRGARQLTAALREHFESRIAHAVR